MSASNTSLPRATQGWVRIPDGTKVRHLQDAYEGYIDGLTELVEGPARNPDGKTQYRVNVGSGARQLVSEENLRILLDRDNLVIIGREKEPYRRSMTKHLRACFEEHRFVHIA
ncbi:MAG TPA: hypothetical protein VD738_02820 [Nitrospira sp.]|jgi:hypothetical protein|nr:hypothetical protein [Nitrospira sp.]